MSRLIGGRYELGEEIGRGGMATVHEAHDVRLGRRVAIKMLHAGRLGDRTFQGRFRREAQAAASLNHPHIVAVFDSGEDIVTNSVGVQEVIPYIVMERVQGHTLSQLMHDRGAFSADEAMRIVMRVLSALGYSHQRGIVHRDVKPGNVMLTDDGDVKVMDFGIARGGGESTATMTQTQAVIGTAQYLSPEQARGQDVDGRSDLYSAGCLLFELVTGRPPFVGDSPLAIAYQHVGEDPSLPSSHEHSIPRTLDTVIMHALVKDRDRRYQTADEFRDDLEAARAGRPLSPAAQATAAALFAPTESIDRADVLAGRPGGATAGGGAGAAAAGGALAGGAAGAAGGALAGGALAGGALAGGALAGGALAGAPGGSAAGGAAGGAAAGGIRPDEDPRPEPVLRDDLPGAPPREGHHTSSYPAIGAERDRNWIAWIVALLLLIGLAGFGVYWMTRPDPIQYKTVPNLMDQTEGTARSLLESSQLKGSFQPKESDKPKGIVVGQNPQPGAQQDPAYPVAVQVSTGPSDTAVPDVTKYTVASAKQRLVNYNLVAGKVTEIDDKTIPAGQVVRTDPAIGQTVPVGSTVALFVSTGKVAVPNVVGQDYTSAAKTLTDAGFRVARKDEPSRDTRDLVLDQDVREGSQPPGTKITLTVAVPAAVPTVTVTTTAPAPTPTTPRPRPTQTTPPSTQPTSSPPTSPPTSPVAPPTP